MDRFAESRLRIIAEFEKKLADVVSKTPGHRLNENTRALIEAHLNDFEISIRNSVESVYEYEKLIAEHLKKFNINSVMISAHDPAFMVRKMVDTLPELKSFKENNKFLNQNDVQLIQQLIAYVDKLASNPKDQVLNSNVDTITLYYNKLFIPICNNIEKSQKQPQKNQVSPSSSSMAVSPEPHQIQKPVQPPPNYLHNSMPQTPPHHISSQPSNPQLGTPSPMPKTPEAYDSSKEIQKLFSQVRTECAVFYATPHPPHF